MKVLLTLVGLLAALAGLALFSVGCWFAYQEILAEGATVKGKIAFAAFLAVIPPGLMLFAVLEWMEHMEKLKRGQV